MKDKLDLDEIARILGIEKYDDFYERNMRTGWGGPWDIDEERAMEAVLFRNYHDALTGAADSAFEDIGLVLVPTGRGSKTRTPPTYKVAPVTSWKDAAQKVLRVINGVGYFTYDNLKEFLDSGPYTAREAVLSNLTTARKYADVYGTRRPTDNFSYNLK